RVSYDLELLRWYGGLLGRFPKLLPGVEWSGAIEEFDRVIHEEMDYTREASSAEEFARNFRNWPAIKVPRIHKDFSSGRVLVMEFVSGTKVNDLEGLRAAGHDPRAINELLYRSYFKQLLEDGFFHADPHPGNLLITRDGRLAILDLGMVSRIDPQMQERLLKLILAVTDGRGNDTAQIVMQLGTRMEGADEARFQREIADLVAVAQDATADQVKVGRIVMGLSRKAAENGIRPAPELTLLGRALLHMDDVSRSLDPEFNPTDSVRRHSDSIMQQHVLKRLSPSAMFSSALETYELAQQLPGRLNTLFESLIGNRLEFKVNAFDESRLMDNLQKIANRIATGLVLAALIVGAALLMQVRTTFTLFGYPGLAMILFLLAAFCGFALVLSILLNDDWRVWRNKPPR
ncbi:MAG: ABC1 kinase family protein, partial [Thermoanaerobaculia bacterium]